MRPWMIPPGPPDVVTRLPQRRSRWFSQGLPCETPSRTHLQTSDALPHQLNQRPKIYEPFLFPKMPHLTK
jgi:hypothetical protein